MTYETESPQNTDSKSPRKAVLIGTVLAVVLAAGLGWIVCSLVDVEDSLKAAKEETAPAFIPPAPKLVKIKFPEDAADQSHAHAQAQAKSQTQGQTQTAPADPDTLKGMQITPVSQLNLAARGLMDSGDYPGAIRKFTEAIEVFKRKKDEYEHGDLGLVVGLQNRGFCKLMVKDYAGAIPDLTAAIKISPNYRDNYVNRAEAYRLLGKIKESEADLKKAKELEPLP